MSRPQAAHAEAKNLYGVWERINRRSEPVTEFFADEIAEARKIAGLDGPKHDSARKVRKIDQPVEPPEPVGSPWRALYLAQARRLLDALRFRNAAMVRQRALGVLQARDLAEQAGKADEIASVWLDPPVTCSPLFRSPQEEVYIATITRLTARHTAEVDAA